MTDEACDVRMSENATNNATQDESRNFSTLSFLVGSVRLISRLLSKWTTQHLSNVFFSLDSRLVDVAPTKACAAFIPSMRLDFDEGSRAMCSS